MGISLVPMFGYSAVCFASPAAWIAADLFLIPASMGCIRRLRRIYPNQPEQPEERSCSVCPKPLRAGAGQ